jgi:serine-type D-Ala-D-Ala carboxypeptidase/endopeptidase (penicillin-binding protein 4)
MKSLAITYIICIIFPLLVFVSCSPAPELTRDTDGRTIEQGVRIKKSEVEYRLQNMLKRDEFKHTIPSMIVMSADYGDTIFSHQSDLLVRPASNQKLLTAASALKLLGLNYSFRTVVYRSGSVSDGLLDGDLIIKGFGDPLLSLSDLDRIIASLRLFGIRQIAGDIIVDDSFFDDIHWPTGWMWDDEPNAYVPFISALSINSNVATISVERSTASDTAFTINVTPPSSYLQYEIQLKENGDQVDNEFLVIPDRLNGLNHYLIKGDPQKVRLPRQFTVTVRDPSLYTGYLLRDKMNESGIITHGEVQRGIKDLSATPIVQINTPIDSILHAMNKSSDNLAAETTWKTMSAELWGTPGTGDGGRRAVHHALQQLGVNPSLSRLADGSGVSFYNLVTARMLAELLFQVSEDPVLFKPFYESLAILGMDGTLMRRAVHSRARGRVRAKTGTLTGVSSLVGYVETLYGERLIVAMLFQNFILPAGRYRQIQDEICEMLLYFNRETPVLTAPIGYPFN